MYFSYSSTMLDVKPLIQLLNAFSIGKHATCIDYAHQFGILAFVAADLKETHMHAKFTPADNSA